MNIRFKNLEIKKQTAVLTIESADYSTDNSRDENKIDNQKTMAELKALSLFLGGFNSTKLENYFIRTEKSGEEKKEYRMNYEIHKEYQQKFSNLLYDLTQEILEEEEKRKKLNG